MKTIEERAANLAKEFATGKQNRETAVYSFDCDQYERLIFVASYIHELQHALRLCGLNDLADNFKIE